ncbi:MAG: hypothetical protein ACTS5A_02355 [Candidatus Hodgkinia cicadicola]
MTASNGSKTSAAMKKEEKKEKRRRRRGSEREKRGGGNIDQSIDRSRERGKRLARARREKLFR